MSEVAYAPQVSARGDGGVIERLCRLQR